MALTGPKSQACIHAGMEAVLGNTLCVCTGGDRAGAIVFGKKQQFSSPGMLSEGKMSSSLQPGVLLRDSFRIPNLNSASTMGIICMPMRLHATMVHHTPHTLCLQTHQKSTDVDFCAFIRDARAAINQKSMS